MEADSPNFLDLDTAQRILLAAERLFGKHGYSGVSTRDIALAAGVSKANIFHHYHSKQALYEAVLRSGASRFRQLLQSLEDQERGLRELLEEFGRQHLQGMLQHQDALALFVRHLLDAGDQQQGQAAENIIEQTHDLLMGSFTALQRQGKLAAQADPSVLAVTLVGSHLAFVLVRKVLAQGGRELPSVESFNTTMIKQLLQGVAPTSGAPGQTELDE